MTSATRAPQTTSRFEVSSSQTMAYSLQRYSFRSHRLMVAYFVP